MDNPRKKVILLADDDEDDRILVETALSGQPITLMCVENGLELMDYLYCRGKYNGRNYPRPDLILLDLNMPLKDGLEALKEVKSDPRLKALPIIILTTSTEECNIDECYISGANSYIIKPMTFEGLVQKLDLFHEYWDQAASLPTTDVPEDCKGKSENRRRVR